MVRINMEETAKGFGFSTQFEATFDIDLSARPPLEPVMDALAEQLTLWTGKRGRLGVRIRLTFRGIDENLAETQAELQAVLVRHPQLKKRLESLQELSASFLDGKRTQIGSYKFGE